MSVPGIRAVPRFSQDGGSFRDRHNRVYDDGRRIVRGITRSALDNWVSVSSQSFFRNFMDRSKVVHTRVLDDGEVHFDQEEGWASYLEHQRIPFVTYPYEWSFGMLRDAALLHLDLVEQAIEAGWTMKDATAYNVQWVGINPIFIDIPSFEPYAAGEPWVGYRQFCMAFLYPLMLQAYKGLDFQPFLRSDLEGIDPQTANKILSGASRFRKGVLNHVYLHAKMQGRYSAMDLDEAKALTEGVDTGVAGRRKLNHSKAMVLGTIQGLRRVVKRLAPPASRTTWGAYDTDHSYAALSFETKKNFVQRAAAAKLRGLAWDLGCNTGAFSRILAEHADYVVSVDGDAKAIDRLYETAAANGPANIYPLIMNLANISPGQGWRGAERKAFDRRARPELILCLALIHHIVISANIPLREFLSWLRQFDAEIVIEFVSLDDAMVQMLLRNRVNQYDEMTEEGFEQAVLPLFEIVSTEYLKSGHRKLYHLSPR